MLVIMGDLLQVSVGTLFAAAVLPGLLLSGIYLVYICALSFWKPELAPPLPADSARRRAPSSGAMMWQELRAADLPHVHGARLDLRRLGHADRGRRRRRCSARWSSPGSTAAQPADGARTRSIESSALTNALVFFIFFGATLFAFVFRALGGDDDRARRC